MPKANLGKINWSSGEISPSVWGRVDSPAYANGAARILNMQVQRQGSLRRRSGTFDVGALKHADTPIKLWNFHFSSNQSYVLEFSPLALRIWRNDALLLGNNGVAFGEVYDSGGQIGITTKQTHGYSTGDVVVVDDLPWPLVNTNTYSITVVGSSGQQFVLDGTSWTELTQGIAYIGGGFSSKEILELVTPYEALDLQNLRFTQSADVLYIAVGNHPPMMLKRYSNNSWALEEFMPLDGPYASSDPLVVSTRVFQVYDLFGIFRLLTPVHKLFSGYNKVSGITGLPELNTWWPATTGVWPSDYINLIGSTYRTGYTGGGIVHANVHLRVVNLTDQAYIRFSSAIDWNAGSGTYTTNGMTTGYIGRLIEFKEGERWRLAQLTGTVPDGAGGVQSTTAVANIFENVIEGLDPGVEMRAKYKKIPIPRDTRDGAPSYQTTDRADVNSGGQLDATDHVYKNLTSNYAVFTTQSKGMWIRPHRISNATSDKTSAENPGQVQANWGYITKVNSATSVHVCSVAQSTNPFYATGWLAYDGSAYNVYQLYRKKTCEIYADAYIFDPVKDLGRSVRFQLDGIWCWGRIEYVYRESSSSTYARVEYFGDIPLDSSDPTKPAGLGVIEDFKMGAWSPGTGYPQTVCFHQGRLVFGATNAEPQTVWMSVTEDYPNFATTEADGTVTDDLGVTFTLASRQINRIKWMSPGRILMLGTEGGEWQIKAASGASEAITASNLVAVQQSSIGSGGSSGVAIHTGYVFTSRDNLRVYDLNFDWELDAWKPTEMTLHAADLFSSGNPIVEMLHQEGDDDIIWFKPLVALGELIALTYNRTPPVVAFWRFGLGQNAIGGNTQIWSIAVCQDETTGRQNLYIAANGRLLKTIDENPFGVSMDIALDYARFSVCGTAGELEIDYPQTGLAIYTVDQLGTIAGPHSQIGNTLLSDSFVEGMPYYYGTSFTSVVASLPMEGGSASGISIGKVQRQPKFSLMAAREGRVAFKQITTMEAASGGFSDTDAETYSFLGKCDLKEFWLKSDYSLGSSIALFGVGAQPLSLVGMYPQQHVFE